MEGLVLLSRSHFLQGQRLLERAQRRGQGLHVVVEGLVQLLASGALSEVGGKTA